jgi:hypothetical protein
MPDGIDVLSALQAWWQSRADLRALTADGQLHHFEAPENTELPYATFFLVSDPAETQTTGFALYRAAVQVNLHAITDAAAVSLGKAFRQAVRLAPLSVDGSAVLHVLPDGNGLEEGEGLGPNGQDCWIATEMLDIPFTQ